MAKERIIEVNIEEEMKKSYLAYSMSVIVSRALPDVRDGLKPVHRRILYAMKEMGLDHNKAFKKSARIVGEVMGKYHPHGDAAVYNTLVRMVQDFSLRYPLITGQGNFGSIDGDPPAAMRYTEAKLAKITQLFLQDIEKNTVDFRPNFDDSLKEPVILPAAIPNILLNGASGIAVAMSTNIPPHNLGEVIDAIIALIDNPDIEIVDLLKYIKGPDFPTGGIIVGKQGIIDAYTTGYGKIINRGKAFLETTKSGKNKIIIKELPYMVNKSNLILKIAELVKDKKLEGISDIRDESDRDGIRIVIELKKDAVPKIILNNLYKHTNLQVTFGVIMLVLIDKTPKVLNLKEILQEFIKFRHTIIIKRTEFDLKKAEDKAHILEGLKIALENIDKVIEIIKKSETPAIAKTKLMNHFSLSERQSQAILDMRLHRLTSLEVKKLEEEYLETIKLINKLREILNNEHLQYQIIKDELLEIKKEYNDERRTEIIPSENENYTLEDLISEEDVAITISHKGYIKRTGINAYRLQRRGGKGVYGMNTNDDDFVQHLFIASTHDKLLILTSSGKVYLLPVYDIPEGGRNSKGKAIINLLEIPSDEKIKAYIPIREFDENHYVIMCTKNGTIKKTCLADFKNIRKTGIKAITIKENDSLIGCELSDGTNDIIIATKKGKSIRFHENNVRPMGRTAAGVRGIFLEQDDNVIGFVISKGDYSLLTVTEKGFGKKTPIKDYRITNRGGKGIINIKYDENRGYCKDIREIKDDDEIMIITKKGILIRIKGSDIPTIGRNTKGVKLINLDNDDIVIDVAPLFSSEE